MQREVQRTVQSVVLYHLMSLASAESAPMQVRAAASSVLTTLAHEQTMNDPFARHAVSLIERFQREPKGPLLPRPLEAPPGQPI
jgi:hypothetical protein